MMIISVIIPTHNSEKTIARTLDSVLRQNGLGDKFIFEILICDDCSTDNTLKVIQKYPVIVLATESNSGGPNAGRNLGITYASGEILTFLDHDDEWVPNKTLMQLDYIKKGYSMVYSNPTDQVYKGNRSLYDRMLYWDYYNCSGPAIGGIMIVNKNVPLFILPSHDIFWRLKIAKDFKSIEVPRCVIRNETGNNLHNNIDFKDKNYELLILNIVGPAKIKLTKSYAKWLYRVKRYKKSREIFKQNKMNIIDLLYYITSYIR